MLRHSIAFGLTDSAQDVAGMLGIFCLCVCALALIHARNMSSCNLTTVSNPTRDLVPVCQPYVALPHMVFSSVLFPEGVLVCT